MREIYWQRKNERKRKQKIKEIKERKKERERNVLFNDTLNTFYLRLYGVRHMVKDHSDIDEKKKILIKKKVLF